MMFSLMVERPARVGGTAGEDERPTHEELVVCHLIVGVAVEPALAWLRRRDHRMLAAARVLAGVTVRRRVATERDATTLAGAQMHPIRADGDALLALQLLGMLDDFDR